MVLIRNFDNYVNLDAIREAMLEIEIARKEAEIKEYERKTQEWCVASINEIKKELEDVRSKS